MPHISRIRRWTAEKDWITSTTSPQICCRTTVRNLNIPLCYFTTRYSMQMWRRIIYLQYPSTVDAKFCFLCLRRLIYSRTTLCENSFPSVHSTHACTPVTPPHRSAMTVPAFATGLVKWAAYGVQNAECCRSYQTGVTVWHTVIDKLYLNTNHSIKCRGTSVHAFY